MRNIAMQWKGIEGKRDEIAASVRKAYKNRDAAKAALLPDFAKAYGAKLALDSEGNVKGIEKKGGAAAKKALQRLLTLAFPPKGEGKSNSIGSLELLVAYIAKSGLSAAQCRRAVEAAFKK